MKALIRKFRVLTVSLLALAIVPVMPATATEDADVTYSAALVQTNAGPGALDQAIRTFARLSGVELTSLRSRAGLGWQVSQFKARGTEAQVSDFHAFLETYKMVYMR